MQAKGINTQKSLIPPGKTVIDINGCHANDNKGDHCGYCHNQKPDAGDLQWGIISTKTSVVDYQKLMDRGWRRCGAYYYKFDFEGSCCQPYTIKLDTSEFQISQSQRKVMKRFNKFLLGDIGMDGNKIQNSGQEEEKKEPQKMASLSPMRVDQCQLDEYQKFQRETLHQTLYALYHQVLRQKYNLSEETLREIANLSMITKPQDKHLKETKSWASNVIIKLFFKLRELKLLEEQFQIKTGMKDFLIHYKINDNVDLLESIKAVAQCESVKIEDSGYISFINSQPDSTQMAPPKKQPFEKQKESKPKEKNVHEKEEEKKDPTAMSSFSDDLNYQQYFKEFVPITPDQMKRQELKHRYTVQITRAIMTDETFKVYQLYQQKVHNEVEKAKSGYDRFLCSSPLFDLHDVKEANRDIPKKGDLDNDRVLKDEGVWPEFLGSYHMIHRIDGEIFAVGVLDYTPQVLSSVYLFYNPKYEFLSPGTFSAIREIEYCLRISEVFKPDFKNYYMGLYFQDCQKSVYKGSYRPSQVLCPHTYNYVYLTDEVREKIAKEKWPKLSDKPIIKELSMSDAQVKLLTKNFKFLLQKENVMLKCEDLNPRYEKIFSHLVCELYKTLGLDVMMQSFFVC